MIAPQHYLPLIIHSDGKIMSFAPQWFCENLRVAAHKAGYTEWWLASDFTKCVARYLQKYASGTTVTTDRLNHLARHLLQKVGYDEIAVHFQCLPPPVWISLPELAKEAGQGYELAFFQILRRSLSQIPQEKNMHLNIHGLRYCVKQLKKTRSWRRRCRELHDEIIDFIRYCLKLRNSQQKLKITIY